MDFTRKTYPHFHQAAVATAFTLAIISPTASFAAVCETPVNNPLMVNIATESEDPCDGQVSLREAIEFANSNLGKDTVTFTESLQGSTVDLTEGHINVFESVNIHGFDDASKLTIINSIDDDRVFWLYSDPDRIDFELSGVTWENAGQDKDLVLMEGYGGDFTFDNIITTEKTEARRLMYAHSGSRDLDDPRELNITLKNSTISGSVFSIDIFNTSSGHDSNVLIENTNISPASAKSLIDSSASPNMDIDIIKTQINGGNWGGGKGSIIQAESDERANVIISETSIQNTITNGVTSALADLAATIKIKDSNINDNFTQIVAAAAPLYFRAPSEVQASILEITGSDIHSNTSVAPLYVIGGSGSVDILDSKISGNIQDPEASNYNLPIIYGQGIDTVIKNSVLSNNEHSIVGLLAQGSNLLSVTIEDSSIDNNITGAAGAVVFAKAADDSNIEIKVSNSTLSGNQAWAEDDSNQMNGGAIHLATEDSGLVSLTVNSSTLTNNTTTGYGGAIGMGEESNNVSVNINNSIVAENTAGYGSDHDLFGDFVIYNSLIGDTSTSVNTSINGTVINLIGTGDDQTPDTGNNILGQDPLLQGLSLSGGTWVHQLSVDSPAIAAGDSLAEDLPAYDQRGEGFTRIRAGNGASELDLGAVQYFVNPVAVNDAISVLPNSENNIIDILSNDAQSSRSLPLDTVTIMIYPENGDAEVRQDGTISYTPNADFVGVDTLIYVMQDIDGNTSTKATVTITVSENNSSSADSGGPLQLWILSLLAVFGLRRKV
jgi:hypothetical protein